MKLRAQWTRRRVVPLLIVIPVGVLLIRFGLNEMTKGHVATGLGILLAWLAAVVGASVYDQRGA